MDRVLDGWLVAVTRDEAADGPLGRALAAEGARVLRIPTVAIGPPPDPGPLNDGVARLHDFDWLIFTSPRAVAAVAERTASLPPGLAVAAVGHPTAEHARAAGFRVDLVGSGYGADELAQDLLARGIGPGTQVFFPSSSRARPILSDVLGAAGATVHRAVAYETTIRSVDPRSHPGLSEVDVVTFTSPSAVEGWVSALEGGPSVLPASVRYVAIGPTTEAALEAHGLPAIRAEEASFAGVVEATRKLVATDMKPGNGHEAGERT